jgi:hypothetical protein
MLKRHYMTFYWKVSKDFILHIENLTSHDSLIGSTISTRSKKNVPCAIKISSQSVLSLDAKISKISNKDNPHVHNLSANRQLNLKIPEQVSRGGAAPDISHILMFHWFEPVLYLDTVSKFQ